MRTCIKATILFAVCILHGMHISAQKNDTMNIVFRPIGEFHTDFTTKTGAPRQGILIPETKGSIEIYPEYQSALKDLNLFEYIIVLYYFNEVKSWNPDVNPPASTHVLEEELVHVLMRETFDLLSGSMDEHRLQLVVLVVDAQLHGNSAR